MKKKQKISDLFYDNRFLFVFSLVVAIGFWLVAVVEFGAETTNVIKGIPVQIDYAKVENNFGLKPFGKTDFTVDVTVSGKKYIVDSDELANDFNVTAATGFVGSPGKHTLKLDITSKDNRPGYDIVEISNDEIEVYFDYPDEGTFLVEADIKIAENSLSDEYYLGDLIFQKTNSVSVTGPSSEIKKIEKIVASYNVTEKLHENLTVDAKLNIITKDGSTLAYTEFNDKSDIMQITLPIYKKVVLPATVGFTNIPSDYIKDFPFKYTVEPAEALFGVPESMLDGMPEMKIASIDFSNLHNGVNTFTVSASDILGVVVLDGTESFTVTVDTGDVASAIIEVTPEMVSFNNTPNGVKAGISGLTFSHIAVYGPKESIEKLTSEDIVLIADMNDVDVKTKGEVNVPAKFSNNDCWSCGEYFVTVLIT